MSRVAAPTGEQMAVLREGAAWAADPRARLDLTGADRLRFLHNLVSCEIRELAAGESTRGFFVHLKGGVIADFDLIALADRLRLVLALDRLAAVRAHLEKYRIVERVEFEPREDLAGVELRGASAPALLATLGADVPAVRSRIEAILGGVGVALRNRTAGREPRFEIEVRVEKREELAAVMSGGGASPGATQLAAAAVECARIEDGELRWGTDFDQRNFPQETGEESAVSYAKGCYLGQEVVARIHYRGGVQRQPRGLRFAGAPPQPGTALLYQQREVGRATSVALSPEHGSIGLSLVQRRVGEPPARVELDSGEGVEIVALPFDPGRDALRREP